MVERLVVWHRAVSRGRDRVDSASIGLWSKTVAARCSAAGGTILASLSGTVVASFESADIGDVLDLVLDLLDEADDGPLAVSFGAAVSGLIEQSGAVSGGAIEIAESLAVRAHPGEVVLDPIARERARGLFLFARQVGAGSAGSKAASIDRSHPRRDACALAMSRLGAVPLALATQALLPALEAALRQPGSLTVLRGPVGAGAVELLRTAERSLKPTHVAEIGAASGGIAPLGSLRASLVRGAGLEGVAAAAPEDARRALESVVRGEIPEREQLLGALVRAVDASVGAVWLFLTPVSVIDAATLALVMALHHARPKVALVVRHAVDAALPSLLSDPRRIDLTLPSLRTGDARVIARAVLGEATAGDVARRVAVLGGDTPLGVVEAARAMIGSGDLVLDGEAFVWRSAPRGGVRALALDVLVAERLELLDDESRRVLEAIAVMPDGSPRSLVAAVAGSDGVRPRSIARGLERLGREGWLDPRSVDDLPRPISSFVRRFVVSAVPPSRVAELHRFVATSLEALAAAGGETVGMAAERAIQLVGGGREEDAAVLLVRAATVAADAGYPASAGQLAVSVLRSSATGEVRVAAQKLARELAVLRGDAVEAEPPRPTSRRGAPDTLRLQLRPKPDVEAAPVEEAVAAPPVTAPPSERPALARTAMLVIDANGDPGTEEIPIPEDVDEETDLIGDVRDAIRRRDFGALEGLAERAIAEGSDMAAVARLRALGQALRGDLAGAQRRLDRARAQNTPRDRRALLTEAMVALRGGAIPSALRLSLSALADARRASDPRGEAVALFTLAACFRALGRQNDAALLESRVEA